MSDWQPIETAPKDGEIILLTDGVSVYPASYIGHADYPWAIFDSAFCVFENLEGRDRVVTEANGWPSDGPTHWMPLPQPPKEK